MPDRFYEGRRPGRIVTKPTKRKAETRTCSEDGCITRLGSYNRSAKCYVHDVEEPRRSTR